jgi:hypothetical protein
MNLIGIKLKDRVLITEESAARQYSSYPRRSWYSGPTHYLFDGKEPEKTWHKDWVSINGEPETVQMEVTTNVNYRFELIDKSNAEKLGLPLSMKREECQNQFDGEWYWQDKYKSVSVLYDQKHDTHKELVDVDFKYTRIAELESLPENGFEFLGVTHEKVKHQLIDEIMFPKPVLAVKPSALSSEDSYEIIRKYIKQHINLDVARIASDYDFCLEVNKIIPLSEVETYTVDVNWNPFSKRKRKAKYEKRYRRYREVSIFCAAPKKYQSYPVVSGFKGESQEDLERNIQNYLQDLMVVINEPVRDCEHCKGRGVVVTEITP